MEDQTILVNAEPIAVISGQMIYDVPQDLYIPPDALRIFLETFEGPLDLLLYLIRKENIDVLDIPIAKITEQYMQYVDLMKDLHLELAAEYLVMAAMLAEIKSRLLLPIAPHEDPEEADPRAELVRRLQEYEQFKKAAENFSEMPQVGEDIFLVEVDPPEIKLLVDLPRATMDDLLKAWQVILRRAKLNQHHHIKFENLSVRERMIEILNRVSTQEECSFLKLFNIHEGRIGVVVTFMAILELLKQAMIEIFQDQNYGEILVRGIKA